MEGYGVVGMGMGPVCVCGVCVEGVGSVGKEGQVPPEGQDAPTSGRQRMSQRMPSNALTAWGGVCVRPEQH